MPALLAMTALGPRRAGAQGTSGPVAMAPLFDSLVKAHRYALTVDTGGLGGPGAQWVLAAARNTQFAGIGEGQHFNYDVPAITAALFRTLHDHYGYQYLAVENGPYASEAISSGARRGRLDSIAAFAYRYPNALGMDADQELALFADVGRISKARIPPIWGIDQMFGALDVLDRLAVLAPNAAIRRRVETLADSAKVGDTVRLARVSAPGGALPRPRNLPLRALLDPRKPADFVHLREWYGARPGSEAAFLIDQLELSARVYRSWYLAHDSGAVTGYESNREREDNMRTLFVREYRNAQMAGDSVPKVLFQMGSGHLLRGFYGNDVVAIGTLPAELAYLTHHTSLMMTVYQDNVPVRDATGRDEAKRDQYGVMARDSGAGILADAALPNQKWTLVDFRALRPYVHARGKLPGLAADLRQAILSFDAGVLLRDTRPGTFAITTDHALPHAGRE